MNKLTIDECRDILKEYDFNHIENMELIDSSHGEDDIRYNYIVDRRYVLRVNSAKVFTEQRLIELNRLVRRYRNYGIDAPLYLCDKNGIILHKMERCFYYVSEYVDGIIPPEKLTEEQSRILVQERLRLIAEFAQANKDIDLSKVMSMYSVFELSPYDELTGIDEKQDNLNTLVEALLESDNTEMAQKIKNCNDIIRKELLKTHKILPRCVFQGDENWKNVCIDDDFHIVGLFDFNMAGTDVIVNYLANNALLEPSFLTEEEFQKNTAENIFQKTIDAFHDNTRIICRYYSFSQEELTYYYLYGKMIMLSSFPNVSAFKYFLRRNETKEKVLDLLNLIMAAKLHI